MEECIRFALISLPIFLVKAHFVGGASFFAGWENLLNFSFSIHLMEEIGIVLSNSFGVGVLGSQLVFVDGQGALVERFRLLVLPLVGVEGGQAFETAGGVGVLGSQLAFADGQGALVERLGL